MEVYRDPTYILYYETIFVEKHDSIMVHVYWHNFIDKLR